MRFRHLAAVAVMSGQLLFAAAAHAADDADVAALKARIEALERELASLKGAPTPSYDLSRFDGTWEGEITRDDTKSCPEGSIKVTVKAGKMEGFRYFRSAPAPAKGTIEPDGSFEGDTNRSVLLGKFEGEIFHGYYVNQECPNRKVIMRKVS